MKDDTIARWLPAIALFTSGLVFAGCVFASLGADVGLWPVPNLSMGQGLPDLPPFAMILFLMGLFGVFLVNRAP